MVANTSETPVVSVESQSIPPAGGARKKWLLIAGVAAVLAVIGLLVAGGLWLLRGSAEPADDTPGATLTPAEQGGAQVEENGNTGATPSATPSLAPLVLNEPALPLDKTSEQLGVTVSFVTSPNFSLSIGKVVRTYEQANIERHAPAEGEPYSELRLLDTGGQVLSASEFAVPTQMIVESEDFLEDPMQAIAAGDVYLVVPLNQEALPVKVQIVGSGGQLFAEQDVTVTALPLEGGEVPELISGWLADWGRKVAVSWRRLMGIKETQAQGSCSPCFVIAVLGDNGESIANTMGAVRSMVDTLAPWSEYKQNIRVAPVLNRSDLGCGGVPVSGGRLKPGCPHSSNIYSALSGMRWNAAVVVTQVDCPNCGSAVKGSRIVAVGRGSSRMGLIGHEMGHAVGRMQDEYVYKFGTSGSGRLYRPNCFLSSSSCQAGLYDKCESGCNGVGQWRPATKLMHGPVSNPFGKLEACIMETEITRDLGKQASCDEDDGSGPGPSGVPPPDKPDGPYWGGGR